ncbi:MAG: hypothetical protein FJ279_24600 [Planctomycetes bacterium]|nr:hypothetical protein [Planctomycetota bacterium]
MSKGKTVKQVCGNCDYFAQSPWQKRGGHGYGRCDGPGSADLECHESEQCWWTSEVRIAPEWTPVGGSKRKEKR